MAISYGYDRTRPRTKVELDASSLSSSNVTSEKPLVLLGKAHGGQPKTPIEITNFAQAKEIFRGGELLDAIELAWRPSPNQSGAGKIFAIRTDEATNATVVKDGLTIGSKLYGTDANTIQVELSTVLTTGAKRLKVNFSQENYQRTYSNVGNIFTVKYSGDGAGASLTVETDVDTGFATSLKIQSGEIGSLETDMTFPLGEGQYENINVLVNEINNHEDYEASMDTFGGNKNVSSKFLDEATDEDIKTAEYNVTAIAGDLISQTRNDKFIKVDFDFAKAMPADFGTEYLLGAETNEPPASWADMFMTIQDVDAYYVVPLTDDEGIHGEFSHFLREQSINGNHLRGFVGGGLDESIEDLRARQMNVRNARVSLAGNSGRRRMADGRILNFKGYMFGAILAGIASGLAIGEPITYKHLNIDNLDTKFTGDQLDQLDGSGIIMAEFVRTRGGSFFRVVSDPTTYNSATEPVQNKIGLGEVSDFLTTELRTILDEEFIGTRIHTTSASILKNRVESFLDNQKNVDGLIVDYSPDDVQVVITGNTARINLAVQPAQGLDYINVHIKYEDNELVS